MSARVTLPGPAIGPAKGFFVEIKQKWRPTIVLSVPHLDCVRILAPDGKPIEIRWRPTGPGSFSAAWSSNRGLLSDDVMTFTAREFR